MRTPLTLPLATLLLSLTLASAVEPVELAAVTEPQHIHIGV